MILISSLNQFLILFFVVIGFSLLHEGREPWELSSSKYWFLSGLVCPNRRTSAPKTVFSYFGSPPNVDKTRELRGQEWIASVSVPWRMLQWSLIGSTVLPEKVTTTHVWNAVINSTVLDSLKDPLFVKLLSLL